MIGYLGNEEETKKALRKDDDGNIWFFTGDLGCIDEDGFVYYKERMSRMIISSGYNIYPEQINDIIDKNTRVLTSSVVGIPDNTKGEIPVAFIVLKSNEENADSVINEIKDIVSKNISKYAIPKDYVILDKLPKTAVGKVDYKQLVSIYESRK